MVGKTNAGGGSAWKAYIKVDSNVGSTVTVLTSPGGVAVGSATVSSLGYAVVSVPQAGTYSVVAALNGSTKTGSVTVSTQEETCAVNLMMPVYLYNLGSECTSVTGGWEKSRWAYNDDYPAAAESYTTLTKNSNNMQLSLNTVSGKKACTLVTANTVNLKGFSSIHVDMSASITSANYDQGVVLFVPVDKSQTYWSHAVTLSTMMSSLSGSGNASYSRGEYTIPIAEIGGYYAVGIGVYFHSTTQINIYKVWLA